MSVDYLGDRECVEIALSIAVPCRETQRGAKVNQSFNKRCGSAPDGLDLLMFGKQAQRRSPTQSRHRFPRRRPSGSSDCSKQKNPRGLSLLDLSALDFSLSEAHAEDQALTIEEEPLSIGLNESDITSKGVEHISRALSFVRLDDKKPLIEIALAYNNLGNDGISSLIGAAQIGALRQMRRLVLSANRLSEMSGLAGAFARGALPALKELVLSSNRIRAKGVAHLAGATLADGSAALGRLDRLYLDHNELGHADDDAYDDDAYACASPGSMSTHAAIVAPSVDAVAALANACTSLLTLDLCSNGLTDAHLHAIATCITAGSAFSRSGVDRACPTCARLDVSLNAYTLAGRQQLAAACDAHGGVRCSA